MITDNYTDIHSHVLFGVDDGAATLEESLETLCLARGEGIRAIFVTPHSGAENAARAPVHAVIRNFEVLKARAKKEFPDLRLYLGSEIFHVPGKLLERVEKGEALPLAGTKYLLIEFKEWGEHWDSAGHICESLLGIARSGWLPILAHAERYRDFQGHRDLFVDLVKGRVYLQINAYDLFDRPDDKERELTRWLAQNRLAHFIGTDTHGYKRLPVMRSGVTWLYDNCDEAYVDALVRGNAETLLAGGLVPLNHP